MPGEPHRVKETPRNRDRHCLPQILVFFFRFPSFDIFDVAIFSLNLFYTCIFASGTFFSAFFPKTMFWTSAAFLGFRGVPLPVAASVWQRRRCPTKRRQFPTKRRHYPTSSGTISCSHSPFLLQRRFFPGTTEISAFWRND